VLLDPAPTPTSVDKKRKLSELSPLQEDNNASADEAAMDLEDALPPADPDAMEDQEPRKSKRVRKGSPIQPAAAAAIKTPAAAAAEAAGRSTRSVAAAQDEQYLSVKNLPVFKDDHLASMVDAVLEGAPH
jgi:hypothetical protein